MNEHFLKTRDNVNIAINHITNGFNEVVIMAPGWFMTKDSREFLAIGEYFSKNFDVIIMDFRGHGKSSGFYTFSAKETRDIAAVVDFAKQNYEKVYLIGFSLGGALILINQYLQRKADKLIAVSAPYSFEKIENKMWKKEAWLQTLKKFELKRWISVRPSIRIRKKIRPIDIVDKIDVPTLFISGGQDPTVLEWHTKALFDKALCEKKYECFENCAHAEDLFLQEREQFLKLCTDWLRD